jgi:phosphoribosylamine--glycine ligase
MKILVIGSGAREHALCWKLAQSPLADQIYCSPGNPGIAQIAECVTGDPLEVAQRIRADFVVVGPEVPLAEGLVDNLAEAGILAFGPRKAAAQLEASKIFCKQLLKKYGIPTGDFEAFDDLESAQAYINDYDADTPIVIKADGLAAGKGVVIAQSHEEAVAALNEVAELGSGGRILIEEHLTGEEVSLIALTDGDNIVTMVAAQDHKRIGEGDTGLNTGGMGCYSPVPAFPDSLRDETIENILKPTVAALKAEGIEYRGALYAGLMLTPAGPKVIEYNCRFGDPETEIILPRLKSDLLPLLLASAGVEGYNLADTPCEWTNDAAVVVIMSSEGYPRSYRKGDVISGLVEAQQDGAIVFHAGTTAKDGQIATSGGRVLAVTALGPDFHAARECAYAAIDKITFDGAYYRRDIGWRCLAE